MHFNDAWAKDVAGGNVLGVPAPLPEHRWHGEVALEAHRLLGAREPYDERWMRAAWQGWLGERSYYQDPLYPYAVAAVYAAGGGAHAVWVLQMGLGVLIAMLVAFMAAEAWDARVGLVAGLMAAVYAPLLFYEATMVRSVVQAAFLVGSVAAAVRAPRSGRPARWWVAGGACAGLAILAHATSVLQAGALLGWAVFASETTARRRAVVAFVGGLALALAPLVARNAAVGLPLLETSSARAVNVVTALAEDAEPRIGFHISAHTARVLVESEGRFLPALRLTLATHPGPASLLALTAEKVLAFVEAREATDNVAFEYFLLHAPLVDAIGLRFAVIAPLAVFGLVLCRRDLARAAPVVLGAVCVLAVAAIFFPSSRVRFPVAFFLMPFAAAGLVRGVAAMRATPRKLIAPVVAGFVAVVLVAAPWRPPVSDLREADFAVGNEIALLRLRAAGDDPAAHSRIVDAQLRTEPDDLRALDPSAGQGTLSARSARLAGSFAALHAAGAQAAVALGDDERARAHTRRAVLLDFVAREASRRAAP